MPRGLSCECGGAWFDGLHGTEAKFRWRARDPSDNGLGEGFSRVFFFFFVTQVHE